MESDRQELLTPTVPIEPQKTPENRFKTRVGELYHSFEGAMRQGVLLAVEKIAEHNPEMGGEIVIDILSKPIHCSGWGDGRDSRVSSHPDYDERDLVAMLDDLPEGQLSKIAGMVFEDPGQDSPSNINRKHAIASALVRATKIRGVGNGILDKYKMEIVSQLGALNGGGLPFSELDQPARMIGEPSVGGIPTIEDLRSIKSDSDFFTALTKIVRKALPQKVLGLLPTKDVSGTNRWFFEIPLRACIGRWVKDVSALNKFTSELRQAFENRSFKVVDSAVVIGSDGSNTDYSKFYGMLESGGLTGLGYVETMSAFLNRQSIG